MPGPTARPSGSIVGRSIMDRVSGSREVSGRSEQCVLASLSKSCRGTVGGKEHGLVSITPRAKCARREMNSPGGHKLVEASAGSEGFRSD
ncbi:hypothetical protein RchiOBHm_Chr5g0059761 [Rosa chinensis]|uniref:Uncharacterized protein n=1 Tax=Rosa chinensis TaxID=74649 RepID=A0A2P6QHI3_ROSCH|nr:hypothetical protein RchiOBHm_Chr5g0059761 [Rosa chinensis]